MAFPPLTLTIHSPLITLLRQIEFYVRCGGKKLGYKTMCNIYNFIKYKDWKKQTKILMEVIICLEVYGQFKKLFILNCIFQLLSKRAARDWMFVSLSKFIQYIQNVMVLGGGVFGKWLGHEGRALENGLVPLKRDPRELSFPSHHVRTH